MLLTTLGLVFEEQNKRAVDGIDALIRKMAMAAWPHIQVMASKLKSQSLVWDWYDGLMARLSTYSDSSLTEKGEEEDDYRSLLDSIRDVADMMVNEPGWYDIDRSFYYDLYIPMKIAYEKGAVLAAREVSAAAVSMGEVASNQIIGLDFNLTYEPALLEIRKDAASMVTNVDDGTRWYLRRVLLAGVTEGLSSPDILDSIRAGSSMDDIMKDWFPHVKNQVLSDLRGLSDKRIESIVNTEINRAETTGRLRQWVFMGLGRKAWKHTGAMDQCDICLRNESLGFVDIGHKFDSVWGPASVNGPPAHPTVCHCHLAFDEDEALDRLEKGELRYWDGGEGTEPLVPSKTPKKPAAPRKKSLRGVDLREHMRSFVGTQAEMEKEVERWVTANTTKGFSVTVKLQGMSSVQRMRHVPWEGHDLYYGANAKCKTAISKSLERWTRPLGADEVEIPNILWEQMRKNKGAIYFTTYQNKTNGFWAREFGYKKFTSIASAGHADIVVYGGRVLDKGSLSHELGHQFARLRYGSAYPDPQKTHWGQVWSDWKGGLAGAESPVSDYGKASIAEDFAEAMEMFVRNRKELTRKAPDRDRIISRLLADPEYGG